MDYLLGSPLLETGVFFKLGFSGLLSLVIGIERELKRKPVGLKTSVVIATFSCLLTIISIETAYSTPARHDINITMDPLRLAAQIVSGIGFLGAGVILKRDNDNITGLTTAAMIWGAAGIGIAVGAGFYIEAAVAVAIVMIGVEFLPPLMNIVGPKRLRVKEYTLVTVVTGMENIDQLICCLHEHSADAENVRMKMMKDEGFPENSHEVELRLSVQPKVNSSEIYSWLHELNYIQTAELIATQ
ncbi:MgtC/SapB family protein [Bhargavaea beijingensis]|uniref:Putative Mg2+ transporter-C (MgtC) family protein n=1 Tax=Bhargavaea beijingensis TaxID=426756 RepID=A0A1G7EZ88_9BACL|nr:MgtC/SapB family protein [Bhargavaea beijingensis]MCW1927650.1 MgtC/SapB family protein [Bhargavaea beijingensis]SDE68944.1 putative Mg2+ transporter-C (MgtC) family protein [Bhargavaea beijingensis]